MRAALPPRDPRLQLPADRHRGGHRPVPARQARPQHGPAPRDRRHATTPPSPDLPIKTPVTPEGRTHVFHQYTSTSGRSATRSSRRSPRPGSRPGSITRSRSTASRTSWSEASAPTCRSPTRASERTLSLPMFPGLTDAEQATVIDAVASVVGGLAPRPRGGRRPMTGAWSPVGDRVRARRARRAWARWVGTTCGSSAAMDGVDAGGGRRPGP